MATGPSEFKAIRDAVARGIKRQSGCGSVPVVAGWSLAYDIHADKFPPGKTHIVVTQGPMGASLLDRGEVDRDIGLLIGVIQILPQQDAPTDSNLDEVVALRIQLEDWLLKAAHECGAIQNPHGDYSFDGLLRAAQTEQPLVEEYLKSNNAVSYFIASWTTG